MAREFLEERVPSIVLAHWRGHPLYIHIVFVLGQLIITMPFFPVVVLFAAFVTGVSWQLYALWAGIAQTALVVFAAWLYGRFSRSARLFLRDAVSGEPLDEGSATAAWLEAVAFPRRVVGWIIVGVLVVYGLEFILLIPRIGLTAAVQSFIIVVTCVIWFGLVIFLFYLEESMRPLVHMALIAGARPTLGEGGLARLHLRTKLSVLTLALIIVPAAILGLFAHSQVVALGGNPTRMLALTAAVVVVAGGAAALQALLLVRSVTVPVRELQHVIREVGVGNLGARFRALTSDELAELGLRFNRMVGRLQQNEELAAAFGRYVSPAVRDGILRGTIALGGRRSDVTILFTNVQDFTAWCERESPETVVQTLNVYYGFLIHSLTRYGGTVTRYTGDGVLALFGAPLSDPDHALHAVQAVWEARVLLDKFNDIRSIVGAFELHTHFGIHSGEAVVGSIGSEARAEYTPVGDAANVASRINGLNKELGTVLLISDDTYQRIADCVEIGQQTEVMVKGRTSPVHVVEVTGLRSATQGQRGGGR